MAPLSHDGAGAAPAGSTVARPADDSVVGLATGPPA